MKFEIKINMLLYYSTVMKTQVNIRNEGIELKKNIIFCLRLVEYVKSPFFPN